MHCYKRMMTDRRHFILDACILISLLIMTKPEGNHFILCFLESQTLIFLRNKGNCFPWDESLIAKHCQVSFIVLR